MHLNFSYLAWQLGRLQQYRQSDLRDAINSLASAIQQLQAKYADVSLPNIDIMPTCCVLETDVRVAKGFIACGER